MTRLHLLGWMIQQHRFISLHVEISSLPTPMTVLVGLGWVMKQNVKLLA